MNKADVFAKLLSVGMALAIFGTVLLPEGTWLANLEVVVKVIVWAVLILGTIGIIIKDEIDDINWWFEIPAVALWVCALAYVGWTIALGVYAFATLIAYVRYADDRGLL